MKEEIISYLKNKNIEIPEKIDEIINLYFGSLVSISINYWFDRCCDFMDNMEPPQPFVRPDSDIAKTDKNYREIFSKLNNESKEQLKNLIKESLEGVLFSVFENLDQSSIGEWKISLKSVDGNEKGFVNSDTELHEDLYKWINIFNEN
jgi:hypothetical protein